MNRELQPFVPSCRIKNMSIFSSMRKHAVISTVVIILAIIIAIIGGRAATKKAPAVNDSSVKQVSLVNAGAFRLGKLSVLANGQIESHSQADLKSQMSAPISVINVTIGETVSNGEVILELQNNDIRAQLAQAEASLTSAQGQFQTGAFSLDSAKQAALDKLRDAYNKTYDAVISQAETILYNNDGNSGRLTSYSLDTNLNSEIAATDMDLKLSLKDWKNRNALLDTSTSTDAIESNVRSAQKNIAAASILLNDMSKIMNNLSIYATPQFAATLSLWKASISGAIASISGANQSLTGAEMSLTTANSSQGTSANAQVTAAEAGVNNLQAQLAKTIIRSPIYGKVSSLPLRVGELASPGSLLATVVGNDNALRIKAYVSGDDLSRIKVGAIATIQNPNQSSASTASSTQDTVTGIVSNVAPGVDSISKKAEVDIDVSNSVNSKLIIGNDVTVAISLDPQATPFDTNGSNTSVYLLPIQDVKIVPGAAYVYTVDSDSKIVKNDVVIGSIQGDFIQVISGLTDSMDIVTPVYELDPGQTVRVQ